MIKEKNYQEDNNKYKLYPVIQPPNKAKLIMSKKNFLNPQS